MPQVNTPLVLIGGGTMAQAIVRGGLDAGVLDVSRVAVVEPEGLARDLFRSWGVRAVKKPAELEAWIAEQDKPGADRRAQLILAIKPQTLPEAASQLQPLLAARRIIISILAGVPTTAIRGRLGGSHAIVRAMPNTAARIRRATTAIALGAGAEEGDDEVAVQVFSALGRVVGIDESLMDAFTAVVGSGPAYVYYLAEAMTKAAVDVGFDRDLASHIVRWTIIGAANLLDSTDLPPETLRAAVTSKGGTTAAAIAVLDDSKLMAAFSKAIRAARDRGAELAKLA